jgi:cysteine synthase
MPETSPLAMIGETPLIELKSFNPKPGVRLFAKLEGQNPSGSIKDRVARCLVEKAEANGWIGPGSTLVEASSGNTAIALAMVARQKGYRLVVVVPEGVPPTIRDILQLCGVEIVWAPPVAGMRGAIDMAGELAERHGYHPVNQFMDPCNIRTHYETTGLEIAASLEQIDAFVAGIGTGGTIMGVAKRLRETHPEAQILGIEPRMGERLQGLRSLSDAYAAPLLDLEQLHGRYLVGAARSIALAQEVARREGLMVGVSSGATLSVGLRFAERLEEGNVVVMFSDGGWKYLPSRAWGAAQADDPELDEIHWW